MDVVRMVVMKKPHVTGGKNAKVLYEEGSTLVSWLWYTNTLFIPGVSIK